MDRALDETLALLESACSVPVPSGLVDQEILETLEDYGNRVRALSASEWGCLRESVMKIAALVYMTYSLSDPDDFVRMLRYCTPAAVRNTHDRFRSLAWLLEHRMLRDAHGRIRAGNLLRFNLNQSRLFAWHNRPPMSQQGIVVLPADEGW